MPIETYEVREGQRVDVPSRDAPPGASSQESAPVEGNGTGAQAAPGGAQAESVPGTERSAPQPPASEVGGTPGEPQEEAELPDIADDQATVDYVNKRARRLTHRTRSLERALEEQRQQHQVELAQTRGQLDALQRMLSGAAPPLPDTPPPPTGPPQAEQFASHEEYVLAAARYGAQQELQARDQQTAQERQRAQQAQAQQQLIEREAAFKQAHPDFDDRVRAGLAGKVSPIVQQALMLIPDGPAVAYALATQPDLVQRLNTLPPPLVLLELGRLSPSPEPRTVTPNGTTAPPTGTPPAALPPPLTPLSGSSAGAPTGTWQEGQGMEAYRAWRKRTSALQEWKNRS